MIHTMISGLSSSTIADTFSGPGWIINNEANVMVSSGTYYLRSLHIGCRICLWRLLLLCPRVFLLVLVHCLLWRGCMGLVVPWLWGLRMFEGRRIDLGCVSEKEYVLNGMSCTVSITYRICGRICITNIWDLSSSSNEALLTAWRVFIRLRGNGSEGPGYPVLVGQLLHEGAMWISIFHPPLPTIDTHEHQSTVRYVCLAAVSQLRRLRGISNVASDKLESYTRRSSSSTNTVHPGNSESPN